VPTLFPAYAFLAIAIVTSTHQTQDPKSYYNSYHSSQRGYTETGMTKNCSHAT